MRKIAFMALVSALVFSLSCVAWAEVDLEDEKIASAQGIVTEIMPFNDTQGKEVSGEYFLFMKTGETDEGQDIIVSFHVSGETKLLNELKAAVGAEVKAYYDGSLPVILIYPPRYAAVAIEVVSEAEEAAEGTDEQVEAPAEEPVTPVVPVIVPNNGIVVNGEQLDAPDFYVENGITMVPLRAICEKLGYQVNWDGERKAVEIGAFVSLTIGRDEYNFARRAPISLGSAPVIKDEQTFVTLELFSALLGCDASLVTDGENSAVIINNEDSGVKLAD